MFERPRSGERAILVHLGIGASAADDDTIEFEELARSAGAEPLQTVTGSRAAPDPRLFVGSGKAEEIRRHVHEQNADVVLFNHALSPSQERNLERLLSCRVLDRTGLILDIFAQRARSFEGKLQVELAQLRHLSTRLVRGWTHLERQKGGIGLRGPGETQLETDRRLIARRIRSLIARLERFARQREQGRRIRRRTETPTIALVGYTNAGKSTLFNRLTGARVYSADILFATLDPTVRRLQHEGAEPMIVADTVGFVRNLPHELVAAFRSTLQEAREADLLLHVVDASDPNRTERIAQVNEVLAEIGAGEIPQIEVFNKLDLVEEAPRGEYGEDGAARRIWLSAADGGGIELLVDALEHHFRSSVIALTLRLDNTAGRLRSLLYRLGTVREERADDSGWELTVELPRRTADQLAGREALARYCVRAEPCAGSGGSLQSSAAASRADL